MSDTIRRNGRSKCWITSNDNRQNIINPREFWRLGYPLNAHSNQSQAQNFSHMTAKRKARKPGKALKYKIDPNEPLVLILRNGNRIKQKEGLDIFLSQSGRVYSLTRYGLRRLRVNYCRKRRYGMKSCNGVYNGHRYPYITFRGGTYSIHVLMMEIWVRPRRDGEEIDHLDGNIDNFALENLEIVTHEENNRRKVILQAMRRAAIELKDPRLDPINKTPEEMAEIYRTLDIDDAEAIMEWEMRHHMEI